MSAAGSYGIIRVFGSSWVLVAILACMAQEAASQEPATDRVSARSVVAYDIKATVDPGTHRIDATARILVLSSHFTLPGELTLDLESAGALESGAPRLNVQDVRTGTGGPLQTERVDGQPKLRVLLPRLEDSARAEIEVAYSVHLDESDLAIFGYYFAPSARSTDAWYPQLVGTDGEHPRFIDFDVTLEYPSGWTPMTSGELVSEQATAAGEAVRATYRTRHVRGFALALGEGFLLQTVGEPGRLVTAFSSEEMAPKFREIALRTAEAIEWYRETLGFFPVPHIGIVQGHPRWGGGYPLPNAFMIHLGVLRSDFVTYITAHELGHYYWSHHVLGKGKHLDWLMLANGIWLDQLYLSRVNGRSLDEQWRATGNGDWIMDYLEAMAGNREQRLGIDRAEARSLDFDYNSLIRHGKAATGVFLQARLLGEDRFLELQRRILSEYRHRHLPEDDFIELLEEAGAEGARDFFDVWKRGDARIDVQVQSVEGSSVTVRRTGNVPYPVDVEVEDAEGATTRFTLPGNIKSEAFTVTGPSPLRVRLDPDGVIPMWNSAHPEMRRLHIESLARAGQTEPFIALARAYLAEFPGDERILFLLSRQWFQLGRHADVVSLGPLPTVESRIGGLAALYRVRALWKLGRRSEATLLLDAIRADAQALELEANVESAEAELLGG
jgi:hypothetical protein